VDSKIPNAKVQKILQFNTVVWLPGWQHLLAGTKQRMAQSTFLLSDFISIHRSVRQSHISKLRTFVDNMDDQQLRTMILIYLRSLFPHPIKSDRKDVQRLLSKSHVSRMRNVAVLSRQTCLSPNFLSTHCV